MRLSRGTVAKWWHRWCAEGEAGLVDRSSRPCGRLGAPTPESSSGSAGCAAAHGEGWCTWQREPGCRRRRCGGSCAATAEPPVVDRPPHGTGGSAATSAARRASWCTSTSRRSPRSRQAAAGECTAAGSEQAKRSKRHRVGYTYLHVAIDDYSRVAYVEAHDNETAATLVGFWERAQSWFWSNDMPVDEVLTDNGPNCVSDAFTELLAQRRIRHLRTRPYRPQTNGKAERFNRTLADEFLYNYKFRSDNERRIRLNAGSTTTTAPTPHRHRRQQAWLLSYPVCYSASSTGGCDRGQHRRCGLSSSRGACGAWC